MPHLADPRSQLSGRSNVHRCRLSKNEASSRAYADMPTEDVQLSRLHDLLAADVFVLLSLEDLPAKRLPRSFLSHHEAKTASDQ